MKKIFGTAIILTAALWLADASYAASGKLDQELSKRSNDRNAANERVRVIIQHYTVVVSVDVDNIERKYRGRVLRTLDSINGVVVEMPVAALNGLSNERNVSRISLDEVVATSGAGLARTVSGAADAASAPYNATGNGIGVAVIDSGFADVPDLHGNTRKIVDFVQDGRTSAVDTFGHGTHVAGIIGGLGKTSSGRYRGIAPGARLVDLRVLDDSGRGYTSDVIAAIEWAIVNRNAQGADGKPLNIRIINL